jgi:menaquinone-dependent protoporphyrinogen oxidase
MIPKILVTYASRSGSTVGVAEEVGSVLHEHGADVEICAIQDVTDVTGYQAVVVGSAIQDQQWLPEAMQFIETRQNDLAQKQVVMFSLCMTLAMKNGEKYRPQILTWLTPVRNRLHPVSEGLFGGVLDIGKIPSLSDRLKFRLSVLFGVWTEGDHRDWDAIHKWASELPSHLLQAKRY